MQNKVNGASVSTSQVAHELDVSNAAISEMAKKLCKQGLVSYEKYKGMELTGEGEKAALAVIRRHRLWELFLIEVLGLSWGEVHEEAEKLEHYTSDFLLDKMDEFLGAPEFDPHGDPIPRKNGELPDLPDFISLADTEKGKMYKIVRVDDRNSELIKYFTKLGLGLDKNIEIVDKLSFDNSVIIKIDGNINSLSAKVAENLFVTTAPITPGK